MPALVDLGTVDSKIVGGLHQGSVKGLIWYNTRPITTAPHRPNWDAVMADGLRRRASRCGASASSRAPTPAGPARTGSRTSSSARPARRSTTPGSPGPPSGRTRPSRPPSRASATCSMPHSAARPPSTARTSATAATGSSPTRPAASSTTRRASSPTSSRSRAEPPTATSTSS